MPQGLYIPVAVGLIEGKHFQKMDRALWTYAELLRRETTEIEVNGATYGLVSGGRVVRAEDIVEALKPRMTLSMARQHLNLLETEGYLVSIRRPNGKIIWVRKSKRGLLGRPLKPRQRAMLIKELEKRRPSLFDGLEQRGSQKKAKPAPKKEKNLSGVNEFKKYAAETYRERFKEQLLISHGKDGDLTKRLLASYDLAKLKRWWEKFLRMKFYNKRNEELPHTIGVFYSVLQKVIEVEKKEKAFKERPAPPVPDRPPLFQVKALREWGERIKPGDIGYYAPHIDSEVTFYHNDSKTGRPTLRRKESIDIKLIKKHPDVWEIKLLEEKKA